MLEIVRNFEEIHKHFSETLGIFWEILENI